MKRVLIFSCGALPAIDIATALKFNDEFELYGASSYDDHGLYVYKNYIGEVPYIFQENFINKFNEILISNKIDFIIPTHDTMTLFLQEHANEIKARIVCSKLETALLCRYKSKTYEALKGYNFTPKTYSKTDHFDYPVFAKKDDDQGGRNAYKINSHEELNLYTKNNDMIISEYLPGQEVTVDCFTDRHGKLRFCNPRAADRMLAGIDVHARRIEYTDEIRYIANSINKEIEFRGYWFFQIKKDLNDRFKLLEISTRFAGAFSLSRCMDINLPLLALKDFDDQEITISFNDNNIEADKMFFGRYKFESEYEEIFLDGEEVIIPNGWIDTFFVMFLYQCVNKNIKINLITRDKNKSILQLRKFKIDNSLFDNIIQSNNKDTTPKDILSMKSLYFSRNEEERNNIRSLYGVLCFDPSVVEVLMDWR